VICRWFEARRHSAQAAGSRLSGRVVGCSTLDIRAQAIDGLWAVIPAGGAGTRLWPLSRRAAPKFLHDLTGTGRTLLEGTWDRLAGLSGGRVLVVTGRLHVDAVRAQLPDLATQDVVAEPSARDSMPAIGLAAAIIERRDPEAVIGSFAADHVIRHVEEFWAAVVGP